MINLEFGKQLSAKYSTVNPYPHIIIDDFIESSIATTCYNEMKNYKFWGWDNSKYSENHQVNKFFTRVMKILVIFKIICRLFGKC
jgi:hypothetical protein